MIARVGDSFIGTCRGHKNPITVSGTITTGSSTVKVNGRQCATHGSLCVASCGHFAFVLASKSNVKANGKPIAQIGDSVNGIITGRIINGSNNVK